MSKKSHKVPTTLSTHKHSPSNRTRRPEQHKPWISAPGTPATVRDYFKTLGLIRRLSREQHEQLLRTRFGEQARRFLEAAQQTVFDDEVSHALMSESLELALAIRSQYWGPRYEGFLSWLATAGLPQPGRILDVGCDIGLQACFYALLFPQAEVTGMDRCPKSIACATKLAEKLRLPNVRFLAADVLDLPAEVKSQKFDMVVSCCVAGNFTESDRPPVRCVEETPRTFEPKLAEYARVLAGFLSDENGMLVTFERNPKPTHLARWLWALDDAGIHVGREKIGLLEFFNAPTNTMLSLPVLIGSQRAAEPMTAAEIRSLWPRQRSRLGACECYEGATAEAVFVEITQKQFRHGFRHKVSNDLPALYTEIWESGRHVLVYDYSEGGIRLVRGPVEDLPEVIEMMQAEVQDVAAAGQAEEYTSPDDACQRRPSVSNNDQRPLPALACRLTPEVGFARDAASAAI